MLELLHQPPGVQLFAEALCTYALQRCCLRLLVCFAAEAGPAADGGSNTAVYTAKWYASALMIQHNDLQGHHSVTGLENARNGAEDANIGHFYRYYHQTLAVSNGRVVASAMLAAAAPFAKERHRGVALSCEAMLARHSESLWNWWFSLLAPIRGGGGSAWLSGLLWYLLSAGASCESDLVASGAI